MEKTDFPVTLTNPSKLAKLQAFFGENQVDSHDIYNMIYFRLIRSLKNFFPEKPIESVADEWLRNGFGLDSQGAVPRQPTEDFHPSQITDPSAAEFRCAQTLVYSYRFALERIFIDEKLPTKAIRSDFVHKISVILVKVLNGFRVSYWNTLRLFFQFQLDQLSWMTQASKTIAYKKIDKMIYNVVYDDWIEDDTRLNKLYSSAKFDGKNIANNISFEMYK